MIIFNTNAAIAIGLAAVIAMFLSLKPGIPALTVAGGILTALAIDIWMRFRSEDSESPLIDPAAGGHIYFLPVWLYSILGMIIAVAVYFNLI
jgi:hypothetical protein